MPSQEDINRWESLAEAQSQEHADKPEPSESEESEETEETEDTEDTQQSSETEPTPSESEDVQNSEEQTPNGSEQNSPENPGGIGFGDGILEFDAFVKWFGIIGGSILFVVGILFAVRYGIKRYRTELANEIQKNMTRKAVKRINRRMYRRVRMCNPKLWFAKKMSDIEYEKALVEQYPDVSEKEWKQFMDIVKKNHYSKEKITVEEMFYCYECYKRCGYENKKLDSE